MRNASNLKQLKANGNHQIQVFVLAKNAVVHDLDGCHQKTMLNKAKLLFHTCKKQLGSFPQHRKIFTITQQTVTLVLHVQ